MDNSNTLLSFLELLGNLSPDAALVYSLEKAQFIYHNKISAGIFTPENTSLLPAGVMTERIEEDDIPYLTKKYLDLLRKGALTGIEFRLKNNGSMIHFSCDAYFFNDSQCIFVLLKDISKVKEHEDYIIEYGARKNALLEIILHSLSGPLHVMQNLTAQYSKSEGLKKVDNLPQYLNLIEDNTRHCIDIVHDLLKNEQFQSTGTYAKRNRFDVIDKLKIIHQQMKNSYPERDFNLKHTALHCFVSADDVKFLQVVNMLMSNAIKFTFKQGKIALNIEENEDQVLLRISDNGIGIPEKLQPFLFDHTTVAGRAGLEGQESTGIGLFICKKLIELMNGRIWFDSIEGKGSNFYVALPKE